MLFVPVWDMNHLKRVGFQYVTFGLIILNALIYFLSETHTLLTSTAWLVDALALRPGDASSVRAFVGHLPDHYRFLSYMFVHASVLHLFGNMVFLFVFGDNVEDALGHVRFIVFYLICGVFAGAVHSAVTVTPEAPLIGASGAIAGVIGAYVVLHPNIRIWVLFPVPVVSFLPLRFSAAIVIGLWLLYQIVSGIYFTGDATAWWAHVGGFFMGVFLVMIMKRRGVRLFDGSTGIEAAPVDASRMSKGSAD
jgi:membrane associated rhomboid family serine protease